MKGKVLSKHYPMKMYGRVEVQFHVFLASASDGGKFSASFLATLLLHGSHWMGG
jgi:hypothetical protein